MITRREAVTGGVLAGLGATIGAGGTASAAAEEAGAGQDAEAQRAQIRVLMQIHGELQQLRQYEACGTAPCGSLGRIRQAQRTFLRGNGKYPDFVEVGLDVWDELIDWHLKRVGPPTLTLRPDGRYTLPFLQTMVILRLDFAEEQVGIPFDSRPGA